MKTKFLHILAIVGFISSFALSTSTASADPFNANNIISDTVFNNANTMSAAEIDAFLNTFPGSCISPNSGFKALDPTGYNPSQGYLYGGFVTAGQVIYDAAQAYGLNPRVLIVTLEKEQSLVTGRNNFAGYCNNGDQHKYAAAVGYGCPDSGTTYNYSGVYLYWRSGTTYSVTGTTCVNSASKAGFSQQVIRAAWLFKFGQQRSMGNTGWAVIKGNWNNTDDPQTCYGGPMTQGTFARCPSGGAAYYDGYTTIDGTSVHIESGATAALYWYTPHLHGNQNFLKIFSDWFGNVNGPAAFTVPGSGVIYIPFGQYKYQVPYAAAMQDFGISWEAVQNVSQAYADSIPSPPADSGLNASISHVVKTASDSDGDGGSIYLVSLGKRYQFQSMQQFFNFGFKESDISYLPMNFVFSRPDAGALSNYVNSPYGSVFQVGDNGKRIIVEYSTYKQNNPGDRVASLSYYLADKIPSAAPLTDRPVLLQYSTGSGILLYANQQYYPVDNYDAYRCWGFEGSNKLTLYRLPQNNYVATPQNQSALSCMYNMSGTSSWLTNGTKATAPSWINLPAQALPSGLSTLYSSLPTRAYPLSSYVKTADSAAVWYLQSNKKRLISTYNTYQQIGLSPVNLDIVPNMLLSSFTDDGIQLANSQLVKAADSAAVYIVSDTARYAFPTSDLFNAYKNSWGIIDSLKATDLNKNYPASGSVTTTLVDKNRQAAYLIGVNGCFSLSSANLTTLGTSISTLTAAQPYDASMFKSLNLSQCRQATDFVKSPTQSVVYWLNNGSKYPLMTFSALLQKNAGKEPLVMNLDSTYINSLPTGSSIY
ncbi:hypothetical protein EYC59_00515 [Candidatus Saccharibacteria bacterium]|nr:MAG: hypothetical protein EYC59_00515 [Candidatus Saccharibacteria bacterium]